MAFFWLLVGIFLVTSIPMAVSLQQMRKHDKTLFQMCQLRRECFEFMRKQDAPLERDDYVSMRLLISALNVTIKRYDDYKTVFFDVSRYFKYLKDHKRCRRGAMNSSPCLPLGKQPSNPVLNCFCQVGHLDMGSPIQIGNGAGNF